MKNITTTNYSRGGRPKLDPSKKRSYKVKLNCTEKEKKYIKNKAFENKQFATEYCRQKIFTTELPQLFKGDVTHFNVEIRRLGLKINKIAKGFNELKNGAIFTTFKRMKLENELEQVLNEYRPLIKQIMDYRK